MGKKKGDGVTVGNPETLWQEGEDYEDWETKSFMQGMVLMTIANKSRALSKQEIMEEIGKYISNEYLSEHIDDALEALTTGKYCRCFREKQLDDKQVDAEGCSLYNLITRATSSSKKKTKCQHSCNCICHKQKGVAHIVACCLPCKECGKNVRGRDYENHMKLCHGKKVVS